ncbi:hypothetical protein AB5N19_02437 [Seiridium cardinale]
MAGTSARTGRNQINIDYQGDYHDWTDNDVPAWRKGYIDGEEIKKYAQNHVEGLLAQLKGLGIVEEAALSETVKERAASESLDGIKTLCRMVIEAQLTQTEEWIGKRGGVWASQTNAAQNKQAEDYQKLLDTADAQLQKLEDTEASLRKAQADLTAVNRKTEKRIADMKEEFTKQENELRDGYENDTGRLFKELNSLKNEKKELEEQFKKLREDQAACQDAYDQLSKKDKERVKELHMLQEDLKKITFELTRDNEGLQKMVEETHEKIKTREDELRATSAKILQLEQQRNDLNKQVQTLSGKIDQLKKEHDEALEAKSAKVVELEQKRNDLDAQVGTLTDKIGQLKKEHEETVGAKTANVDELEQDRNKLKTEVGNLNDQIDRLKKEHEEALKTKSTEILGLEQERDDLKAQVEKLNGQIGELKKQTRELDDQIQDLNNNQIKQLIKELKEREEALKANSAKQVELEQERNELKTQVSNLTDRSNELEKQLEEAATTSAGSEVGAGGALDYAYGEYITPILKQVALYREGKTISHHQIPDGDVKKDAMLGAMGAVISQYDHNRRTPTHQLDFAGMIEDLERWLLEQRMGDPSGEQDEQLKKDVTASDLQHIIDAFNDEVDYIEGRNNPLKLELGKVQAELDELRDRVGELPLEPGACRDFLSDKEKEVNKLQEEIALLNTKTNANKELEKQLTEAQKERRDALAKLQTCEEEKEKLGGEESQRKESEIGILKIRINDLKKQITVLEAEKAQCEEERARLDKSQEEIDEKEKRLKALQQDHQKKTVELERMAETSIEKDELIRDRDAIVAEKDKDTAIRNGEMNELRGDLAKIKLAMEALGSTNASLTAERENLKTQNNGLRLAFNQNRRILTAAKREVIESEDELERLNTEYGELKASSSAHRECKCTTCAKLREHAIETGKFALDQMEILEARFEALIEEEQKSCADGSKASSTAVDQEQEQLRIAALQRERDDNRLNLEEARRQVDYLQEQMAQNHQHTTPAGPNPPVDVTDLQEQNQTLQASLAQALDFGRKLLKYYRKMQAVLVKYRAEKHGLVNTFLQHNPAFMEDMDIYLEADERRLEARLNEARNALLTAADAEKPEQERQVRLLERELEKYHGILEEIRVHSRLADEAIVVSEIYNLDPDDHLVQQLLEEHPELVNPPAAPPALQLQPRPRSSCDPCSWLFWLLLAAIALFVFGYMAQRKQRDKWAVANSFTRALWINNAKGGVTVSWAHLAMFVLWQIPAHYERS